ncbi:type II toxin-antitoxin system VapC family toxin [Mucilaginibacter sp.]|uniref:type II toxin-antitoxin system VapC family toxin n=1 Tax=Mucilaginibacter sp. TaxID=1882438 RepID=UPI0028513AF9|nr:type II toxin-antitoxin system VapC family toxin [Mucilaginibacter sp.]MDR3693449.1 type II toxin-antitoxin system VapC family toxin [Mucilaginibacter sp.]
MTGSKCLLDTSVIIHIFKSNPDIIAQLRTFSEIFLPSIAAGELYYGAYCFANIKKHLDQSNQFLKNYTILSPDVITADFYGRIKKSLKDKGKPIPENDIWIAAIAIQFNLPLFATDKHFREINNITLI